MDQDREPLFSDIEIDLPSDLGDVGGVDEPPIDGRGGGGRGPSGGPPPEPFVTSRWGVWIAVGLILLFGTQSLAAVWLSRSGIGTELLTWGLGAVIIGTFTLALIGGARYIGHHRY